VRKRPWRYGMSRRFETMPSRPSRQACSNTVRQVLFGPESRGDLAPWQVSMRTVVQNRSEPECVP
jgi:hypothetical protein